MLVALTILSIIITTVYGVLSRAIYAKNHSEERADLFAAGREAALRIAEDLESALPPSAGQNVFFIGVAGKDRVPTDAVGFVMDVRRDLSGTQQRGGRANVTYQLEPIKDSQGLFALLRHEELMNPLAGEEMVDPETGQPLEEAVPVQMDAYLLDQVVGLRLRYLDPYSGEWLNAWDTSEEPLPGKPPRGLPGIVEIQLYLGDSGGNPVDFSTRVDLPLFVVPPTPVP
jgi:hypothetical protein